ncbi:hypothetical protein KUCAC02_007850 [Chaenocephalus aceratus]|uniref:Uncharacterized protein n=1 Tax=Chaenocephalus aceratus TaxID=36190 RepID=A0ACB9X837_CHAAC|nr:hypothetical protein KUCAC02_007850 [Chaenocephalus aceratus]
MMSTLFSQFHGYRLVRPQQTEHRQAVHRPETQLRARACEFHLTVREETYTQQENPPPTQEGAAEDVAVEEEPQDRHMEGMVVDEEGHQVERRQSEDLNGQHVQEKCSPMAQWDSHLTSSGMPVLTHFC